MLTGYNTDIRRGDLVVHVQTEDKGVDSASVESLVYLGGKVVASKVSSYSDLLDDDESGPAIARFMDRQHRTVVAAVERGRLDDKLGLDGDGDRNHSGSDDGAAADSERERTPSGIHAVVSEQEIAPAPDGPLGLDLSSATPLAQGETVVVWVRATHGDAAAPGVDIRVEMISTVQEPVILASGKTDPEGLYKTDLDVPELEEGSAAIIVSGADGAGFAEVKQLL